MLTSDQAKTMARRLRTSLTPADLPLTHARALELVAHGLGFRDWNTASSRLDPVPPSGPRFTQTIPILRIFDERKAREFYGDFLGFEIGFEHRFEPDLPLYLEVERAGLTLHLSEHHGDASPGATVFCWMEGLTGFHDELIAKRYAYGRPGVEDAPWGRVMEVHDPFGNRIRFSERS